jgi:hypothetical protein
MIARPTLILARDVGSTDTRMTLFRISKTGSRLLAFTTYLTYSLLSQIMTAALRPAPVEKDLYHSKLSGKLIDFSPL